jgi:hypothetical protein
MVIFPELAAMALHFRELSRESGIRLLRSGAPGGIRTPDPLLRRQTLFPTELRARK